jgi:hypothetical protein
MDSNLRMTDSQDKKPAWTQWDIEKAWFEVVAARESGDIEAEALGMRRFSEGLRNSAMGAAGFVLRPLDEKIDGISAAVQELATIVTNARQADLNWRTEERLIRDAQSTRLYVELDKMIANQEDLARRLGKHSSELETIVRRLDNKRAELDLIQREIAELKAWRDAQERGG